MLKLTEELRAELKKPFGKIVPESELPGEAQGKPLVCIGDYSASVFIRAGRRPDIIIYDLKTKREPVGAETIRLIEGKTMPEKVKSPPGFITDELIHAIERALKSGGGDIFVEGEDDLAALVVLSKAPNGSAVVYGLPEKGAVLVQVESETRNRANAILNRFEKV